MIERILEHHEEVAGDDARVYASIAHKMRWWMNRPFTRRIRVRCRVVVDRCAPKAIAGEPK